MIGDFVLEYASALVIHYELSVSSSNQDGGTLRIALAI